MDRQLPLRITVVRPPAGVAIQVQRGRTELVPPTAATDDTVTFDFRCVSGTSRRTAPHGSSATSAQGPSRGRFVYVNAGKRAGQADSCWDRRAKVSLMTITSAQIDAVLAQRGAVLEARIEGTAPDGGPACATAALLDHGWRIVRTAVT